MSELEVENYRNEMDKLVRIAKKAEKTVLEVIGPMVEGEKISGTEGMVLEIVLGSKKINLPGLASPEGQAWLKAQLGIS